MQIVFARECVYMWYGGGCCGNDYVCKSRLCVVYVSGCVARVVCVCVIASVFEWWYKGVGSDRGVMCMGCCGCEREYEEV